MSNLDGMIIKEVTIETSKQLNFGEYKAQCSMTIDTTNQGGHSVELMVHDAFVEVDRMVRQALKEQIELSINEGPLQAPKKQKEVKDKNAVSLAEDEVKF